MEKGMAGIRLISALFIILIFALSCDRANRLPEEMSSVPQPEEIFAQSSSAEEQIKYISVPRELTCDEKFDLSYVGGRIRTAVLFGVGIPGDCLIPSQELPILIEPYQIGNYWVRVVSAKNPKVAAVNEVVRFSITSESGASIIGEQGFVSPLAVSGSDGLVQDLEFFFKKIGVYRLSIQHFDGDTISVSYSPPIIVVPPTGL